MDGKVLYVATVVKTHIMEFHIPYLEMFKEMGWETAVAARNDYNDSKDCKIPYCDHYYDIPIERQPFRLKNLIAYKKLKRIIDDGEYDIIHCHTPMGAALTRLAAGRARKKGSKVFYTAHGFHFYKGAPFINWLVYYPVEKILARMTDVLITINKEDYERAKSFKAGRVEYIPGIGIDNEKFRYNSENRCAIRRELGIKESDFVILTVGELIPRKNHKVVLETILDLKNKNLLGNIKYVICGSGKLESELKSWTNQTGLSDSVIFAGYRKDVEKFYSTADLFVFMSKQEGLPVALMEAMAAGLPAVCSDIRGNKDLITDGYNGFLIHSNVEELGTVILKLKNNPAMREKTAAAARDSINKYGISDIKQKLKGIYGFREAD